MVSNDVTRRSGAEVTAMIYSHPYLINVPPIVPNSLSS